MVYNLDKIIKVAKVILGIVFVFVSLGIAGTADMVDEVIYNMPNSTYNEIKAKLSAHGNEPSDYDIATYYTKNYGNTRE